ncbi:MAG: hypothetical protein ACLP1Y_06615 [Candidatus Acidiferrales bacterium]
MYTCRECETEINAATELCPHCGADLTLVPQEASEGKPPASAAKRLARWAVLLAILLAAMWSFLWLVVSPRTGNPGRRAEEQTVTAIVQVRAALLSYAQAQGGAYPPTLEPLGDSVRAAAQLAQSQGYQLQYVPGALAPDGTIHGFSLQARAGNYGYRNFYSDESGVVRATREDRAATAADPPLR